MLRDALNYFRHSKAALNVKCGAVPKRPPIILYSETIQIKKSNMKSNVMNTDSTSHTFLTGAILFANLDYSSFAGYAVKAAIGGAIWMLFKLAGDYLSYKLLKKEKNKEKEFNSEEKED